MTEERPYLQIPLTSPEDWRLYEEWLKKQAEEEEVETQKDRVIIIDL